MVVSKLRLMIHISFAFNVDEIDALQAVMQNTEYPWLKGGVCIYEEMNVCGLQNVPVVGLLYHLYEKIASINSFSPKLILVSDDIHYNINLSLREETIILRSEWGFYAGEIVIRSLSEFMTSLEAAIRNSYALSSTMVPKTRVIVKPALLQKILAKE
jgi:hypothetical protein